jgi:hypothetical protein
MGVVSEKEQIESRLVEALRVAHVRYENDRDNLDEYVDCLKRLSDFLLHGIPPDRSV